MKPIIWLPSSCALILILAGCANNEPTAANNPLGTGPYDEHGNYIEAWANDPSKWRKPTSRQQAPPADELPVIAANEEPPPNANPLSSQGTSKPKSAPARVESTPRETVKHREEPKEVEVAAKPKPKPTVVKTKPKTKPKASRYIVKKGDSLSTIASRNGSSVSAIQRANGVSGTLIRPGQALVIPRR